MGRHMLFRHDSDEEFVRNAELQVEALNHAVRNLPADRMRLHICWGNYAGPHTHDIPLTKVLPTALKAKPMGLLIEGANARHGHEWEVFATHKLPDDKVLVPGVLDSTSNIVEHPELVAQRIVQYANQVGKERVIAGTDCGFGTFAGFGAVHPSICWAKMKSLAQGAQLASERLWGKG
jgi:5-methyltetrahydropteroyltriglutamate--homocysteine methyltransferase